MNELTQDITLGKTTLDQAIFRVKDMYDCMSNSNPESEEYYFKIQTQNILFLLLQERGRLLSLTETQQTKN